MPHDEDVAVCDPPEAMHNGVVSGNPKISVSVAGSGDHPTQLNILFRPHVYSHATGLSLPRGDHGLVYTQYSVLDTFEYNGQSV